MSLSFFLYGQTYNYLKSVKISKMLNNFFSRTYTHHFQVLLIQCSWSFYPKLKRECKKILKLYIIFDFFFKWQKKYVFVFLLFFSTNFFSDLLHFLNIEIQISLSLSLIHFSFYLFLLIQKIVHWIQVTQVVVAFKYQYHEIFFYF